MMIRRLYGSSDIFRIELSQANRRGKRMLKKPTSMAALRVFLAVAKEGSMLGAARVLETSQSAVSQTVRLLEEQFGVPLVNRTNRPLSLTPFGFALRNRADSILENISSLKAQVLDAGQGIQPELRIGLVDSFASTCGAAFVEALLDKSTQLTVRTGLSPAHGERLMRREIDLAVCSDAMLDVDHVERRRLFTEKYLVISPRNIQINVENPDDIRNLSKMVPMVRFYRSSQTGQQIERFLRAVEIRVPNWLEVDSAETLTKLVASGVGWAITTPMCLLQGASAAKNMRLHFKMPLGISRSLYLIARHDEYSTYFENACAAAASVTRTVFMPGISSIHIGLKQLVTLEETDRKPR